MERRSISGPGVARARRTAPSRHSPTRDCSCLAGGALPSAELAGQDQFSGQLLVARGGKILLDQSWGLADREARTPVSANSRFRSGSMNKMFTSIAILQLVEAGKIGLSEPLARYLPDYPNKELAAKVTIRHLLAHTGGTGDIFSPGFASVRLALRDHDAYITQFGARLAEPAARRAMIFFTRQMPLDWHCACPSATAIS